MRALDFIQMLSWKDFHGYILSTGWVFDYCRMVYIRKSDKTIIEERDFEYAWDILIKNLHEVIYSEKQICWTTTFDNLISSTVNSSKQK